MRANEACAQKRSFSNSSVVMTEPANVPPPPSDAQVIPAVISAAPALQPTAPVINTVEPAIAAQMLQPPVTPNPPTPARPLPSNQLVYPVENIWGYGWANSPQAAMAHYQFPSPVLPPGHLWWTPRAEPQVPRPTQAAVCAPEGGNDASPAAPAGEILPPRGPPAPTYGPAATQYGFPGTFWPPELSRPPIRQSPAERDHQAAPTQVPTPAAAAFPPDGAFIPWPTPQYSMHPSTNFAPPGYAPPGYTPPWASTLPPHPHSQNNGYTTGGQAMLKSIPSFGGRATKNVRSWLEMFEAVCASAGMSPAMTFPTKLTEPVRDELFRLGLLKYMAPDKLKSADLDLEWTQLKLHLAAEYGVSLNPMAIQVKFNSRRQMEGETVRAYYSDLQRMALEIEIPDKQLIAQFLFGLRPTLRAQLGTKRYELEKVSCVVQDVEYIELRLNWDEEPRAALTAVTVTEPPGCKICSLRHHTEDCPELPSIQQQLRVASHSRQNHPESNRYPREQRSYQPPERGYNRNHNTSDEDHEDDSRRTRARSRTPPRPYDRDHQPRHTKTEENQTRRAGSGRCPVHGSVSHDASGCWVLHPELRPHASDRRNSNRNHPQSTVLRPYSQTPLTSIQPGDNNNSQPTANLAVITVRESDRAFVLDALIGGGYFSCLIDSGTPKSFVHSRIVPDLRISKRTPPDILFKGAQGAAVPVTEIISTFIKLHPRGQTTSGSFFVCPLLSFDVVLGTELLGDAGALLDFRLKRLLLEGGDLQLPLTPRNSHILDLSNDDSDARRTIFDNLSVVAPEPALMPADLDHADTRGCLTAGVEYGDELSSNHGVLPPLLDPSLPTSLLPVISATCPPEALHTLLELVKKFEDCFTEANGDSPCHFSPFTIDTGKSPPAYSRPFRTNPTQTAELKALIGHYIAKKWIEPTESDWSSNCFLVKRDGKIRLVMDFRKLNALTTRWRYQPPTVQECLDALSGCVVFTLLDLQSAYHQCRVDDLDRKKLAFTTPWGMFAPTVLLFGPTNAPAYFQQRISTLLSGIPGVTCYLDDIMIASKSHSDHIKSLEAVLIRLRRCNLKIKPSKAFIAMPRLAYLGFEVDANGVHPQPRKLEAINNLLPPTNVPTLRSFLGLVGYYQTFISNFAITAHSLYSLLKKGTEWDWTSDHQRAFVSLKTALTSTSVLATPDFSKRFELLTDASAHGIGGVLQQRDANGNPRPCAYASRTLSGPQSRYIPHELEALSVVYCFKKFEIYLRAAPFDLFTDHKALTAMMATTPASARIARWVLYIQDFQFSVVHIAGRLNVVPDALSRLPTSTSEGTLSLMSITSNGPKSADWPTLQANDSFASSMIASLRSSTSSKDSSLAGFRVISDILYVEDEDGWLRVIVPASMQKELLHLSHDSASLSAHMGVLRSHRRLTEHYFWPNMARDMANHVQTCNSCQGRKGPAPSTRERPSYAVLSNGPGDLIAMDIAGPKRTTPRGSKFILVIRDLFTCFTVAVPLNNTLAETVAEAFLSHWLPHHSAPARILTDNGSNFTSGLLADVTNLLQSARVFSSPYHPQTNGSVERFNRSLNDLLSHFINERQDDWDKWLPLVSHAYNTTYNPQLRTTPFFIAHGYNPTSFIDDARHQTYPSNSVFGEEARAALRLAQTLAINTLIRNQHRTSAVRRSIDLNTKFKPYKTGDEVLILDPTTPVGLKGKYIRRWKGPYVVIDASSTNQLSYVVQREDSTKTKRVHADFMKPAYVLNTNSPTEADDEWDEFQQGSTQVGETTITNEPSAEEGSSTSVVAEPSLLSLDHASTSIPTLEQLGTSQLPASTQHDSTEEDPALPLSQEAPPPTIAKTSSRYGLRQLRRPSQRLKDAAGAQPHEGGAELLRATSPSSA